MSTRIDLEEAATAIGAIYAPSRVCRARSARVARSVSADTRSMKRSALYVALRGARHDGSDYIGAAFERGAVGALTDNLAAALQNRSRPSILVENSLAALGRLARWRRAKLERLKVVAITGSAGKTTVKELTAAVLSSRYKVSKSPASYNNHIGVPLSMLNVADESDVAALELGMNAPGEISELGSFISPDIGLITNVGRAHLGAFGSISRIAEAKWELVDRLKPGAKLILNGDDRRLMRLAERSNLGSIELIRFGRSRDSEARLVDARIDGARKVITIELGGDQVQIKGALPGAMNDMNFAAAAAVGHVMGIDARALSRALSRVRALAGRFELIDVDESLRIIDDTYNANPDSLAAAIEATRQVADGRELTLALGEMKELGSRSGAHHERIARIAAENGFSCLVGVGRATEPASRAALKLGLKSRVFIGHEAAARYLLDLFSSGRGARALLIKGSRAARMEKLRDLCLAGRGEAR